VESARDASADDKDGFKNLGQNRARNQALKGIEERRNDSATNK